MFSLRQRAACLFAGLSFFAVALPASGEVQIRNAAVGSTPRDLVYNAAALKPIVEAAKTRRIDIAGIGDSNQIAGPNGDYGWDHGYAKAWSDRFGWYSTGVYGMNPTGGWNGPAGYIDSAGSPFGAVSTGAPAALDKYKLFYDSQPDANNDFPPSYAYFPDTFQEPTNSWQPTAIIKKNSPLWGRNLTWDITYGTFATGAGGFTPSVTSGFNRVVADPPRVNTSTGVVGLQELKVTAPFTSYSSAPTDLQFSVSGPKEGSMKGPFFGLWQRIESDRTTGVSYSTMLWQGGRALVNAATGLKAQSDDALKEYVRNLVKLQAGDPMLLVNVNHGGNDGGQTIPSVGPNPAPSNTPAGFADDMEAVIIRMRGIWTGIGYKPENLVFQYGPYHPTPGYIDDAGTVSKIQRQAAWENAVIDLSQRKPDYNLAVVRGTQLTTPLSMDRRSWYDLAGDAHLTTAGYLGISELAVRQVIAYTQDVDPTKQSGVTSLSFTFDSDVGLNLMPDDLKLKNLSTGAFLDSNDLAVQWDAATKTATWTFQGLGRGELPIAEYEATVLLSRLSAVALRGAVVPDYVYRFTAGAVVPEPAALGLLCVGALALRRRRAA